MGFRFRHSIRLLPGVRLNVSASGGSLSVGRPGATLNAGRGRVTTTVGLPGTGLSYRTSNRLHEQRLGPIDPDAPLMLPARSRKARSPLGRTLLVLMLLAGLVAWMVSGPHA